MNKTYNNYIKILPFVFLLTLSVNLLADDCGADIPFISYEAEDANYKDGAIKNYDYSIQVVSSEKEYVHLGKVGSYIEFSVLEDANRLTLRYNIPKGSEGTISVYLNGSHNQNIKLTSEQCYDSKDDSKPRRYDEKSIVLETKVGDLIKIQKDEDDVCDWYGIDLIDLEMAPEPITMPANYLSIVAYGAIADDEIDDTDAIEACINDAATQNMGVWIPPGKFLQSKRIAIPESINLFGAGIWYSNIHNTLTGTTFSNDIGYSLKDGSTISDIKFTGVAVARGLSSVLFRPIRKNESLQNLWIQNVGCVYGWDYESANIVFKNSRIIGTYFDGVHWGDGNSHENIVENVFFRGSGDDAIAQVNRVDMALCYNNIARSNSIIASYWGRGMANVGGDSLIYADNFISSCYLAGLIIYSGSLGNTGTRSINEFQFLRNTIRKCGHIGDNLAGIHIALGSNPIKNVIIKDNIIEYGETEGIHISNSNYGDDEGRTIFENNIVRYNKGEGYNDLSSKVQPILINNTGMGGVNTGSLINKKNSDQMIIFPNPVKNDLNIKADFRFSSISIYNNIGKKILMKTIESEYSTTTLPLGDILPGIYLLEIESNEAKVVRKKIIKL